MSEYDKLVNLLDFAESMQRPEKEQNNTTVFSENLETSELNSPSYENLHKIQTQNAADAKVQAFKRAQKTTFEDIRNLLGMLTLQRLGLEMDLMQVASKDLSFQDIETIKFHKEVKEILQTYQKVNGKLETQVADISELVDEQVSMRDAIITKYDSIFASVESKLEHLEKVRTGTTADKEQTILQKIEDFKVEAEDNARLGNEQIAK